ncbi:MAG: TAXI family TRAP transporter solute-binding subunit [Pseudomonadota bacterium]
MKRGTGLGVLAAALIAAGTAGGAGAMPQDLVVVTGNTGGTFYPVGVGVAQVLSDAGMRTAADVGGGNSNVISISSGQADIGFTFSPTVVFARNGEEPFTSSFTNLKAIATIYDNVGHIAVTEASGVDTVEGLRGQPFGSQPLSAGSSTFFRMILDANGLSEDDLDIVVRGGPAQGAQAVRDRQAIGFHATTGAPNGAFTEAFVAVPMQLLTIDDATVEALNQRNPGIVRATIPAGTYEGQDEPVETIGIATILIVNEAMSDDDAYAITKALIDNVETLRGVHGSVRDLSVEFMSEVSGIEMHPGAARAYAEAGY